MTSESDPDSDSHHNASGPHQNQPLVTMGASPDAAGSAVIALHGRGATARSILQFVETFRQSEQVALAPQAMGQSWYPNSFLAETESNEPGLSSGLQAIDSALVEVETAGIPLERTLLLGFSQGACLTAEFVARKPRRYGGVAILSGGVIGPETSLRDDNGSFEGTPIFIGCSDNDPHIPLERVHETTTIFEALEGDVTERIYERMGHGINEDEQKAVTELVERLG